MNNLKKNGEKDVGLKRVISFPVLLFYTTGTILGLGIYVLLGKIIGEAGSLAPFAFLVASILAIFTGLSYSELSARIPQSGGAMSYVDESFHNKYLSKLIGWLLVISAIISTATVLNGYVGYVHVFVNIPPWIIISTMVTILSGIAIWGIGQSAATIMIITLIEFSGIILVIVLAGDNLAALPERINEFIPSLNLVEWKGIFMAAFLAFFTFIGFEDVVNVAEETKNPQKNMPRAIIGSLLILTVLYVIIAIIGILGLSPQELDASKAPLADILAKKNPNYPMIISGIGLVAIINGVMVQIVMNARVLYGMAKRNLAPKIFGIVNKKTRTPIWSTIFSGAIILVLALLFDLENLARATNYVLLFVFIFVNLALIIIKRRRPTVSGVRSYPMVVPVLGCLFTVAILCFQIYSSL